MKDKRMESWWEGHFNEFISDLSSLVEVPSVSVPDPGNTEAPFGKPCNEALRVMQSIAARYGFKAENDGNHYLKLLWEGREKGTVGLFCHLDVVPAGPGWSYPEFKLTREEDIFLGRGTSDNKGPALTTLYSLRYLRETGWEPEHTILLFFGVNEECGMADIKYFTGRNPMPLFSLVPDSRFPVCYGEKGIAVLDAEHYLAPDTIIREWKSGVASNSVPCQAEAVVAMPYDAIACLGKRSRFKLADLGNGLTRVTAYGEAAHAMTPEKGISAQNVLAEGLIGTKFLPFSDESFLSSLLTLFGDCHGMGIGVPFEDDLSGRLTHIGGFSSYDGTGPFRQNINIRYNVQAEYDQLISIVEAKLKENGFILTQARGSRPMSISKDHPMVRQLTALVNEEYGTDLGPYVMGGGTYARHLRNAVAYGTRMPGEEDVFGPARGHAHQPDEYVSREKLEAGFSIYSKAIPLVDAWA